MWRARLDANQYISDRLDHQIDWYDSKSQSCQRYFKRLRVAEILIAGSIPLLPTILPFLGWSQAIASSLMGAIVAMIAGILGVYQFQELWIEYRTTCETLKHQKYLFLTGAPPYDDSQAFDVLVENVESTISKEHSQWASITGRSRPQTKR